MRKSPTRDKLVAVTALIARKKGAQKTKKAEIYGFTITHYVPKKTKGNGARRETAR
jgi:hypothetical protein